MPKKTYFVIDPANPNPEVAGWRTWYGLEFEIRAMSKEDVRRAKAAAVEYIADNSINDEVSCDRISDQYYLDVMLKDWRGPVTKDHKKLPVTAANKFALVNAIPGLLVWLTTESADIARRHYIKVDGELENSEPGRNGSPTDPGVKTAAS